MVYVKIKTLKLSTQLPQYAHPGDSGMDLRAEIDEPVQIPPGQCRLIGTGIAIELPEGHEAQVRPRSGMAKRGVWSAFGTVDSTYRGEIGVILNNHTTDPFVVSPGDRIAQLVVAPVSHVQFLEVGELGESVRGGAGFGSTGVA